MKVKAKELIEMYGINRSTLWTWQNKGLPVIRNHPHYVEYDTDEVAKWVKENRNWELPKK